MTTAIAYIGTPATGLYTAAQVRAIDDYAINTLGIASFGLMTKAAEHALEAALQRWPEVKALRCFCGVGNNGGDGFVLAALARKRGLRVEVVMTSAPDKLRNDAQKAYLQALGAGVRFVQLNALAKLDSHIDLVVDALLGTGQNRPPNAQLLELIENINALAVPVLALDIPTGLCADTGQLLGEAAVKAQLTVSFIGLKQGLLNDAAQAWVGDLVLTDLELPDQAYVQQTAKVTIFSDQQRKSYLPARLDNSHKGDHGRCLIAGGNTGYFGAALLSATAALRCGVGLQSVLSHPDHAVLYAQAQPEIMSRGFDPEHFDSRWLDQFDLIGIGPGLGQDDWAVSLCKVIFEAGKPLVIDADALNLMAQKRVALPVGANVVLTPHPGEAARLLEITTAEVQSNRMRCAQQLAEKYHATVVLKGAGSLVVNPEGEGYLITTGNPGLATGGSGDVLTGVICAMLAQNFGEGVALGAYIHGFAADLAAESGQRGMLPSDVVNQLGTAVNP